MGASVTPGFAREGLYPPDGSANSLASAVSLATTLTAGSRAEHASKMAAVQLVICPRAVSVAENANVAVNVIHPSAAKLVGNAMQIAAENSFSVSWP